MRGISSERRLSAVESRSITCGLLIIPRLLRCCCCWCCDIGFYVDNLTAHPRLSFKHWWFVVDYMCAHFRLKWNEIAQMLSAFENRLRAGLVQHTMQTIRQLSRIKTLNSQKFRRSNLVGEERAWWKGFASELSLKFKMIDWTSERRMKVVIVKMLKMMNCRVW